MPLDIPPGWNALPLADCMAAIIDYRGKTPRKTTTGVPLVTAKVVKNGRIEDPTEFIDPAEYDEWMRRGLPAPGDVVITTEAPLGEVAQLDGRRVALAQRLIALRGKPGLLDNTFLKFLLQSSVVQEQLHSRATGTTVLGIKQSELRQVVLPLPSYADQRSIVEVLGALDDKVDLNRRLNHSLEAMAQALFKSWFVDFDPVRAKAKGRQPVGMEAETAALFPSGFVDSELGEVPRGWRVAPLSAAVEVNPPRSLRKGEVAPYLDMKNIPTAGHLAIEWEPRPCGSGARFTNGDTLLARITPCLENGKTAFVDFMVPGQVGWGSTEYIVLRPKKPLPEYYAYLLARSEGLRAHAIQSMTGTTGRQRVPASALDHFMVAVPPPSVAVAFGRLMDDSVSLARTNDQQSRTLRDLRDLLLPKLLSGEFRVKDAKAAVAATA